MSYGAGHAGETLGLLHQLRAALHLDPGVLQSQTLSNISTDTKERILTFPIPKRDRSLHRDQLSGARLQRDRALISIASQHLRGHSPNIIPPVARMNTAHMLSH
jgi:hypothetical protein